MHRNTALLLLLAPFGLGLACAPPSDDGPILDPHARTYYEDVAPILADNCYQCHREDAAGPFVLQTYDDVEPLAEVIEHVTTERSMPPWLADNSGACGTWRDAAWLSDDEIDTIQQWVADGAPAGDPDAMPEFTVRQDTLEDATHELEMTAQYIPSDDESDDYRCFLIDPGLDTRKFLTAYEIVPGDPKIVHHVIVYSPTTDEAVEEVRALDEAEAGDGYTCFGGPETDDALVAAVWAPGRMVWSYPEGMGVPIEPGRPQIVQMHYNVLSGTSADKTTVRLKLEDQVDQELLPWFFANTGLVLSPGLRDQGTKFEISTGVYMREGLEQPQLAVAMDLVGIAPHMHLLGKSEHLEVTSADGTETTCLLDVPRWDFNWQFAYFFDQPIHLEPNDLLRMTCNYDTRGREEQVEWGDGTQDEMCLALMFTTFPGGKIPEG